MSGFNLDSLNMSYPTFGLGFPAMPTDSAGLGGGLSGSLFNPSMTPLGFDNMFAPNYGDMFASQLNGQAWQMILSVLANYQMPEIDLSQFMTQGNQASGNNPAGYGNYNYDITQRFNGNASDIDKHLKGVLKGKGAKFMELQEKYGISASVMASICCNEGAYGESDAAKNLNNVAGIMSSESKYMKLRKFDNVDQCLESLAQTLKKYSKNGRRTISQVHEKYCPIAAKNDPTGMNGGWGSVVNNINNRINGNMA